MENHFGHHDWLAIYSDAILDHNLDTTMFSEKGDAKDIEMLRKKAEYARWIAKVSHGLKAGQTKFGDDAARFLVNNDAQNLSQQTLYTGVIHERQNMERIEKDMRVVDRHGKISAALSDFNSLQART